MTATNLPHLREAAAIGVPGRRGRAVAVTTDDAREDTDPGASLDDATERLNAAVASVRQSPLYAFGALADARPSAPNYP